MAYKTPFPPKTGYIWFLSAVIFSLVCSYSGAAAPLSLMAVRKKVAIEGVVYCSHCHRDAHYELILTQTPIPGAVVKLQCNNTRRSWEGEEEAKTGDGGKFQIQPKRVSSWGAHKCRSPGIPYPDPDSYRWMPGFGLTRAAVNASSPFQYYYAAANTLSFFAAPYSPCLP